MRNFPQKYAPWMFVNFVCGGSWDKKGKEGEHGPNSKSGPESLFFKSPQCPFLSQTLTIRGTFPQHNYCFTSQKSTVLCSDVIVGLDIGYGTHKSKTQRGAGPCTGVPTKGAHYSIILVPRAQSLLILVNSRRLCRVASFSNS